MPSQFNNDIVDCLQMKDDCYKLDHCGLGNELYSLDGDRSVRDTHQFSMEVIMHYSLLSSPYRTMDPNQAQVFYIPAYMGLACLCHQYSVTHSKQHQVSASRVLIDRLFHHLELLSAFMEGRPHFMSLGKIQREQASTTCPLLLHAKSKNITFITIEKESNPGTVKLYGLTQKTIVAPYPSYVHYNDSTTNLFIPRSSTLITRDIFIFLAAGHRRSNPIRAKLMDKFTIKTTMDYDKFRQQTSMQNASRVFLITDECQGNHKYTTIPWMMHSVFCLQPPGDSPTRKSFYDAIQCGCIPVLFRDIQPVSYPFERVLDYSSFTYTLSYMDIMAGEVDNRLNKLPLNLIGQLQRNVRKVARPLQYSITKPLAQHQDATKYILDELQNSLNL